MITFAGAAKKELILGMCFLPPALATGMATPYFVGRIIDAIGDPANNPDILQNTVVLLLGISVGGAVATSLRNYYVHYAGELITRDMRAGLFAAILRKKMLFFDKSKSGDLINRLSADTSIVSASLTESLSVFVRSVGTIVLGTSFLFYTSWQLAVVSCVTLCPIIVITRVNGSYMKKRTAEKLEAFGRATASAQEAIANVRTVALFSKEGFERERFGTQLQTTFELGKSMAVAGACFMGLTNLTTSLSMLAVLGYGTHLVTNGHVTPGELTTFLLYALNVGGSVFGLASVYSSIMSALGACDRIFQITEDTANDMEYVNGAEVARSHAPGVPAIRFEDVRFSYPLRPEDSVLQGLDLSIPDGSVVAVVGPSGCGKSTLIALLARFYEPKSGQIFMHGQPVSELSVSSLRAQIATVTQDASLFSSSIKDNIRYGNLQATDEEIVFAAKMAYAHDFISQFPDGYDTLVGERGASLSGGQRQRICIARALLGNPSILILDEATSALDSESEWLVQRALDQLMVGRTTLVITHRLATIQNVDYIAVLDQGKVVEFGPRRAIVENKQGHFAEYFARLAEQEDKEIVERDERAKEIKG